MRRLTQLLERGDDAEVAARLESVSDRELARLLRQLNRRRLLQAFELLPEGRDQRVVELLAGEPRAELLEDLPRARAGRLFVELEPDDRAWIANRVPSDLSEQLLEQLAPAERDTTLQLMAYPPGSTGRVMSPHVMSVAASATVAAALELVRSRGEEAETVYMLPVVDEAGRVQGVVSLRRLVLSPPETSVRSVMSEHPVTTRTDQDQEEAARVVREAGLIAAPVLDPQGQLVGVLSVDDAMRILEEAAAEDAARGTGSERLRRSYRATSVIGLVRARIGWLLVLIIAATLTVNVLDHFEDTLTAVVTLALFVPLLIGTGGNAGAQAATTVVRAMAVDDIGPGDLPAVLARELATGLALGTVLAAIGFLPATLFVGRDIAVVVSVSLISICVLATGVGALIPMLARGLGIDPAVVSAPFISTVVDATGLVVYFVTAQVVLGL